MCGMAGQENGQYNTGSTEKWHRYIRIPRIARSNYSIILELNNDRWETVKRLNYLDLYSLTIYSIRMIKV